MKKKKKLNVKLNSENKEIYIYIIKVKNFLMYLGRDILSMLSKIKMLSRFST